MRRALVVLPLLVGICGCIPQESDYQAKAAALQSFESPAMLADYFNQNAAGAAAPGPLAWIGGSWALPQYIPYYYPGNAVAYNPMYSSVGGLAGTNLQALWADEMDTARMQGDYLYVLDDYGLSIVKAVPADQMKVVGRFSILDRSCLGMHLLDGQKAVVVTTADNYYYADPEEPGYDADWLPNGGQFFDVYVLDMKDPANPAALARYSIQGNVITARVSGGDKLVALSANFPDQAYSYDGIPLHETLPLDEILPQYRLIDADGNPSVHPLLTWDAVLRPANPDGNAVLAVVTIDLADPASPLTSTGMLGYWETAYATPTSLYLTNTPYMPAAPSAAASQPYMQPAYRTTTEIHRFDLTGPAATYAGSIKLDGRPGTYEAFSEKDGQLRVVMTGEGNLADILSGDFYFATYYLLKPASTGLEIAGKVEHIVSEIDPYYSYYINLVGPYAVVSGYKYDTPDAITLVVDMKDQAQPALLGESALPGDSSSMHMLDLTHMLTMGSQWADPSDPNSYDASYNLCLYDVTQVLEPTVTHRLTIGKGYTSSDAAWNDQQLWLADGLFILPIDLYEGTVPNDGGLLTFSGLYGYHLSLENGFEPLGRVETADTYRASNWTRPIVRDGILYAVTNAGVKAVSLDDMSTVVSSVHLP